MAKGRGQREVWDPTGGVLATVPARARSLNVGWGLQAWLTLSSSCSPFPGGPSTTAQPAGVWSFRGAPLTQVDLRRTLGGSIACSGCVGIALSGRKICHQICPLSPSPLRPVFVSGLLKVWYRKMLWKEGGGQASLGVVRRTQRAQFSQANLDACGKVCPAQLHYLLLPLSSFSPVAQNVGAVLAALWGVFRASTFCDSRYVL